MTHLMSLSELLNIISECNINYSNNTNINIKFINSNNLNINQSHIIKLETYLQTLLNLNKNISFNEINEMRVYNDKTVIIYDGKNIPISYKNRIIFETKIILHELPYEILLRITEQLPQIIDRQKFINEFKYVKLLYSHIYKYDNINITLLKTVQGKNKFIACNNEVVYNINVKNTILNLTDIEKTIKCSINLINNI